MRNSMRKTVAWRRHAWKAATLAVVLEASAVVRAAAQTTTLPFDVGERLRYRVQIGKLGTIGEGEMSVSGPVDVRGTETFLLRSEIRAKFGFVKTTDRAESWIDPTRMAALRYQKRTHGAFTRDDDQRVELYPNDQHWEDEHGRKGKSPTAAPLDELSFIYFLRTLPLASDTVDRVVRHYDRDRNPIAVRVIGRDTITTKAGTFSTIAVEMRVKDPRRYGGEGVIRLQLSDDAYRYPVRIESSVPVLGATVLTLESYTRPPQHFASQPE